MEINVAQLLESPIGSTQDCEVDEIIEIVGGSRSPVQGKISLMRTGRGILAKGTLHTEVGTSCSRCLNLFNCPLVFEIEEEYYSVTNVGNGTLLPPPDEPGGFTIDENHILDLTGGIRQYALLEIPMKPLCRDDCAGLCPVCGQDLNYGACACPLEEIAPSLVETKRTDFK